MKILHIVSNISLRSGIMSVLMSYYRNMNTKNFSFEFLFFDDREITYKDEIEKLGGKVHKIEYKRNYLKLFVEVNKFIKNHISEYQIIHLHEIGLMSALIGIKNKDTKIIAHAHATKFSEHRINAIRNRIISITRKITPDYFFACSQDAGKAIFGNKFKKNGCVLNNAIDLSKFHEDLDERKKIRNQLNISNKYVVGHVGNFNQQKNHSFLIDVFNELQKKNKDVTLLLVGDGEKREEILKKCQNLGIDDKVIYLGIRNDINKIMNCFDCFVLPSMYEGLGIVLIEAQATGIPCVFSDVVPNEANILTKNNKKLSLNESPEVWANVILNLKKEIKYKNHEVISKSGYNIKNEAKKLEKLYKNIVNFDNFKIKK